MPNCRMRNTIIAGAVLAGALTMSSAVLAKAQQEQMADLEARVSQLERVTDNKVMFDLLQKIEALQQEVQGLRDQTERNTHELDTQSKRQKDLYLDIDKRILRLEGGGNGSQSSVDPNTQPTNLPSTNENRGSTLAGDEIDAAPAAAPAQHTSSGTSNSSTVRNNNQPDGEYESYNYAFTQIKNGEYEQSINSLQNFLASYPSSSYAANAQYWLAEANYVLQRYDTAVTEFKKVADNYPSSAKVSDAMLKLGYTYYEQSKWQEARDILKLTSVRYLGSDQAVKAMKRLDRMIQEGH